MFLIFLVAKWALPFWAWILILLGVLIIGALVGFLVARKITKDYMDKNPPINEKMIRVMYQQMGRTPTEKQVRQVLAAVKAQQGTTK